MKRRALIVVALAVLTAAVLVPLGAANLGPLRALFHPIIGSPVGRPVRASAHGGIERINIAPYPEGPPAPSFVRVDHGSFLSRPLGQIKKYIPDPLPPRLIQDPS